LSHFQRVKLLQLVYKSHSNCDLVFAFSKEIWDLPFYDKDVLPLLIEYCQVVPKLDPLIPMQMLEMITALVLTKAPISMDASQFETYTPYVLDFSSWSNSREKKELDLRGLIEDVVKKGNILDTIDKTHMSEVWAALTCLPHISPEISDSAEHCASIAIKCLEKAIETEQDNEEDLLLQVLCTAVQSYLLLANPEKCFENLSYSFLVDMLREFPSNKYSLQTAAFYCSKAKTNHHASHITTEENLLQIFPYLEKNFSSGSSQIRRSTIQICCSFPHQFPVLPEDLDIQQIGLFEICRQAEMIEPTIQTYRDKLVHLRKLDVMLEKNQLPVGPYELVPLRYLLGNLSINFTLLWEPVKELVKSYAEGS